MYKRQVDTSYEDGKDSGGSDINYDTDPSGSNGGTDITTADANLPDNNTSSYEDKTDFGLNKDFNSRITQLCSDLKDENKSYWMNFKLLLPVSISPF